MPSQLLKEISENKLTGHCIIYMNSEIASTVFNEGRCVLAKKGQFCGFDAFKRIDRDPSTVSAELYTFTAAQLELSIEFNHGSTVVFPKKEPLKKNSTENTTKTTSKIMAEVKRQQHSEGSHGPDSTEDINTFFEFRPAVNPKIRKPKREFQLPRGKFVASQNSITLLEAIRTAEESNFSGYLTIETGIRKASLIYRNGMCIMIDFPPKYGEEAVQDIQMGFDHIVTAEMYEMSQPQMELALEFNEGYWANNWTKGTGVSITSISREIIEITEIASIEPCTDAHHIDEGKETVPQPDTEEQTLLPETGGHPHEEENPEELDNFAREVNTLENMDMELMESRVRESFRDVIKELDLDYLIIDAKNEKKRTGNIND